MFVHSILAFWDLLIPWNITLTQYLRFYGAFLIYILLLGFSTWYYWKIWSTPEWSVINATRWVNSNFIYFVIYLFIFMCLCSR